MKLKPSLLLILVIFILMGSVPAWAQAVMQTSPNKANSLLADDFQPDVHGFQFKNYGRSHPEGDLTIAELRTLFGDVVCAQIKGDTCIPTPQAEVWIAKKNKSMEAGHCIGFTVMSYRLLSGEFSAAQFAQASSATSYDIAQDVPIMRQIAQSHAMYYLPGLHKANAVTGTPTEIVKALLSQQGPVDLGIFANDRAGHSMLAYGVNQNASGQYEILVYDNNYPGETKSVLVDPTANTWSYQNGAVSPGDTTKRTWAGNAKSATLEFIPLAAYVNSARSCPYKLCPNAAASEGDAASRGSLTVAYQGEADLIVTDSQGQNSGRAFGQSINTIPDASLLPVRGTRLGDYPPEIDVPADQDITVRLLTDYAQVGDLQLYAPDFTLSVDGLTLTRNRDEELTYAATTQQTHYIANHEQQPTFKVATANYLAIVGNLAMRSTTALDLAVDPTTQNLTLVGEGLSDQSASLLLIQLAGDQINLFASNALTLPTDSTLTLDIAGWDGNGTLNATVTDTATGQSQPLTLENQPLAALLQRAKSGQEIVTLIGDLAAYLSQSQLDELLGQLGTFDLDAYDLGTVLFRLQPTDEQLINFISQARWLDDAAGLAKLLFAQNKTDDEVDRLIGQLKLTDDVAQAVRDELARLAQVNDALIDWDSYNPDDKLAALPQFLNDQALDGEQIAVFLKTLTDLPLQDKADLVSKLALTPDEQGQLRTALGWVPPTSVDCVPTAIASSVTPTPTVTTGLTETMPADVGIINRDANLRSGPGTNYPIVGSVKKGERVTIIGINPTGDWYQLKSRNWIARFLVDGVKGPIATVDVPPAPEPTPTTLVTASMPITPMVQATSTPLPPQQQNRPPVAEQTPIFNLTRKPFTTPTEPAPDVTNTPTATSTETIHPTSTSETIPTDTPLPQTSTPTSTSIPTDFPEVPPTSTSTPTDFPEVPPTPTPDPPTPSMP